MKAEERVQLLQRQNEELRLRLQEAQDTLTAIHNGEIDALVVEGPGGGQIFTLKGADHSYRVLIEEMTAGALTLAADGSILYANRFMEKLLDTPLEKVVGSPVEQYVHAPDRPRFLAVLEHCASGQAAAEIRMRAAGRPAPVYVSATHIELEGVAIRCLAVTDLTDQKRQEAILGEERLSRSIIDQSADAIIVCNERGTVIRASRVGAVLIGRNCLHAQFNDIFDIRIKAESGEPPGREPEFELFLIADVINGQSFRSREAVIVKDGAPANHLLLSAEPLSDDDGQVIGAIVNLADISVKVKLENQLKESEQRFRSVVESNMIGVVFADPVSGKITDANDEYLRIVRRSREELRAGRLNYKSITPPEVLAREDQVTASLQPGERLTPFEKEYLRPDGVRVPVIIGGSYLNDSRRQAVAFVLDITERKRTEEALRESEERFRSLFENSLDAMFFTIPDGRVVDANPAACKMFGRSKEEFIRLGRAATPAADPGEQEEAVEQRAREGLVRREVTYLRKDGSKFTAELSSVIIRNSHGEKRSFVILHDITVRKRSEVALRQSEERLKASLAEKEVLLQEIHHRVKNNMQVISSLVDLQANEVREPAMRLIFQDIVYRVRSMAMVHEKLYQSADFARVDFADYADSLLGYLWRAQGTALTGVELKLELEPVWLPVNHAVPCGLILNELFTNALTHAFRGRDNGTVAVSLHVDEKGRVNLSVSDNGIGLPSGFDLSAANSLGLRLVQMLGRQLAASVDVSSEKGTRFTVKFENSKQ